MAKAGLNALTWNVALQEAQSQIKVIGVDPGWMRTDMGTEDARYRGRHMPAIGKRERVALRRYLFSRQKREMVELY